MLFSSITFIFYFLPIFLVAYYIFWFSITMKNIVLLIASLFFYAWGNVGFVFILLLSIFVNYIFGLMADSFRERESLSRLTIFLMCAYNIGILFVFRYMGFLTAVMNDAFNTSLSVVEFSLPVGISFFTFKAMSYVIDVHRKKTPVQKNIFYVALYLSLFPQIEAGPVVQYASIEKQLTYRKETPRMFAVGWCRFISGLAKKVLIANQLAVIADNVFAMNQTSAVPASLAWIGSIAFTLQIFFDISGYSDIAIGLCLMVGFKIGENFNYPYISKSITEFWRRWHISVMQWFNEYVHKPLGGADVKNNDRVIRNLFIVWLLMGLWHGAEWTFLIWGLMNFMFLFIEKLTEFDNAKSHKALRRIYTLFVVNLLWIIFRSENLVEAGNFIGSLFGVSGFHSPYSVMFLKENAVFFVLAVVFSTPVTRRINRFAVDKAPLSTAFNVVYPIYIAALFIICVSYIAKDIQYPFIYFNY